jgi:TIR domain
MPLYTSSYLKQRPKTKSFSERQKILNESKSNDSFDIFLCHCLKDKADVQALYDMLTDMDYSVYVDWIVDPQLDRTNVTKESAELIRKRMRSSKSLLLAISLNAALSKWMPWELGYVDGHVGKCAIIPVSENIEPPKTYQGFEYLKLYPYIKHASLLAGDQMYLVESSHSYTLMSHWIRRNEKPIIKQVNIDYL